MHVCMHGRVNVFVYMETLPYLFIISIHISNKYGTCTLIETYKKSTQ